MESSIKPLESIDLYDPQRCDVTFLVEGKLVRYNRSLLELFSPVFSAIFSERWSEGKDPLEPIELELKYCDMCILFKALTPYGFRSVCFGNVKRLLELGDFYQIGVVALYCEHFLLGNVSRERFMLLCELAVTFDLAKLLELLNQEYILLNRIHLDEVEYLELLVLCAKATPKLDAMLACVEQRLVTICAYVSPPRALDWLIAGYESGSKLIVDKSLPIAAKHTPLAKLLESKTKLSDGLHCELMLQHYACSDRKKKPASKPRSESVG